MFIGRAVAVLAADKKVMARSGEITSSWELARHYGFTDSNGSRPDLGRHFRGSVVPSMKWLREGFQRQAAWLDGLARRAWEYLGEQ